MVTALAYQAVMREGDDDDAESDPESHMNPGKANHDSDNDEELGVEQGQLKTQKQFRQLDAKMNGYRRQVIDGKAFFFNPSPEHLPQFLDWLVRQMQEGFNLGLRRRAVFAVDVVNYSKPRNLLNVQKLPFLETQGKFWRPRTLTLVEDHVVHACFDSETMGLKPVESRLRKTVLLV
jgi:hypothetical protein